MASFLRTLLEAVFPWLRRPAEPRLPAPSRRPPVRAPEGVQVQYAPVRDGDPDPGEVVWTWVPYEDDPSQGKDRPVLVIGVRGGRRVGLALTSRDNGRRDHVEVGRGAWDGGKNISFAKLDRLIDLEARPIRREGAVLDRARFDAVISALRAVGEVPVA
jgi:PemK-like, MazF-like toxin of type II toxin-antitoxin system